ncbi:dynein light chain 2, cytoplasmic-like [Mya arenaria]|uniref:dynein light chain 2, cytoplasmic-like n=1 Tax=Mya arenaria TaxID=6604 RepID=UPI0022E626FA|nr:dynein light chain 2, cytoplasmic-like [Mya arenaria]
MYLTVRGKWRAFRYNYTETHKQANERSDGGMGFYLPTKHSSSERFNTRIRSFGFINIWNKSAIMTDRKAVIKNADMSEEMQQDAIDCASQALEKYNIEKDIAAFVKKEFDKKYNPTWHAIVGRNFGSYVTHETKHFIYFYLGQVAILLFKSG